MAEGANFAPNLQHTPSIFEVSASEVLDNLIYPAFSKIFDYLGLRFNVRLNGFTFSDDLSPAVTFALQYFYLNKRGGSFGESFYGLQRTSASLNGTLMSNRNKFLSASLLTFLPYFEKKLRQRNTQHEGTQWEEYLIKVFHAYNAAKAINTFLYLTKYSISQSPILRLLGLTLRYPKEPIPEDKASYMILKLFEVMAFFLQFIQWWYTNKQRQKISGLQNPDAIRKSKLDEHRHPNGICPICLMRISNPTACAVSGYVFCWKCIANHLKQRKKCPVSGYPIGIEDLVRIYDT